MRSRNTKAFAEKLRRFSAKNGFFREGEKTLVGFSGGADSVCLLHALSALLGRERLVALHINHKLRGEDADGDEAFCRRFCEEHGIKFLARQVDISALCGGVGVEDAARNARYALFAEVAKEQDCSTVSLAHTASDNLETMLFHLCRGGGLTGLSGIPVRRKMGSVLIVRPLLPFTREDILSYLAANGLPHREDSTNGDTKYTRNFLRHKVVPLLKTVNGGVEENAFDAAGFLADAVAHIKSEATAFCEKHRIVSEADISLLLPLSPALRYEVLSQMARNAKVEFLFSKQAQAVTDLIEEGKKGKHTDISSDVVAALDGTVLRFLPRSDFLALHTESDLYLPLQTGENRLPNGNILYLGEAPPEEASANAAFHGRASLKSAEGLYLRSRREGESYHAGGMTRRLKKVLCGAPESVKRQRPVLCDSMGILWFPSLPVRDGEKGDLPVHYLEF